MEEINQDANVVTLLDEDGKEIDFDLLLAFDHEGKRYIALLPMEEVEGVGENEVVLLEVRKVDGEEVYETIENPVLLEEVFNAFTELFDDMLDEEEDGEETDPNGEKE